MNDRTRAVRRSCWALFALVAVSGQGRAAETAKCATIADERERLACYDALAAAAAPGAGETFLERHWDLAGRARILRPWAHRPTYLLPARWSDDPNEAPPDETGARPVDLDPVEIKFQVSFKSKLWEGVFGGPGDLWFGYTQQSHFQIYNAAESRPFRETDHEPEAMVSFPMRARWGEWTWRVVGAGIVHQSNGRTDPLSRSWNRIQAFAGVEKGALSIQLRPWWPIQSSLDDNPEIAETIGRFEAVVLWTHGRHALLGRGRSNLEVDPSGGSVEVDWFFPVSGNLRGQVQLFTGYGESLIDYEHQQTTLGVGFLLFDPF